MNAFEKVILWLNDYGNMFMGSGIVASVLVGSVHYLLTGKISF